MRFRPSRLLLGLAFVLGTAASACGSNAGAVRDDSLGAGQESVLLNGLTQGDFYTRLSQTLKGIGYRCEPNSANTALLCKHTERLNQAFEYKPGDKRLVHTVLFGMKAGACEAHPAELNAANWTYGSAQVACKDTAISFTAALQIPRKGISIEELSDYLQMFDRNVRSMITAADLRQYIE